MRLWRRARNRLSHQGACTLHWEDKSPEYLALKARGAKSQEFLKPVGLKAWNFKRARSAWSTGCYTQ